MSCDCPASIRTQNTVITEAHQLVSSEREHEHGSFETNTQKAAQILETIGVSVKPHEIPIILFALKLARHTHATHNRDNIVDAIGYLALYARLIGIDK